MCKNIGNPKIDFRSTPRHKSNADLSAIQKAPNLSLKQSSNYQLPLLIVAFVRRRWTFHIDNVKRAPLPRPRLNKTTLSPSIIKIVYSSERAVQILVQIWRQCNITFRHDQMRSNIERSDMTKTLTTPLLIKQEKTANYWVISFFAKLVNLHCHRWYVGIRSWISWINIGGNVVALMLPPINSLTKTTATTAVAALVISFSGNRTVPRQQLKPEGLYLLHARSFCSNEK